MKTLINTLYIGLLIIAPICGFFCGYFPVVLVAFVAVLFWPRIPALILNTAHKIAISLFKVALLGSSNTLCKDGKPTGFCLVLGAIGARWLMQLFYRLRPTQMS